MSVKDTIDYSDFQTALDNAQEAIEQLRYEAQALKDELEAQAEALSEIIDSCETIEADL